MRGVGQQQEIQDAADEGNVTNLDAAMDEDTDGVFVTVKMKLNTFLHDVHRQTLKTKIEGIVLDANCLIGQAYAFANFHVLRLLDEGHAVPKIDRSFYYRCLLAVSHNKARATTLGDAIVASRSAFDALRPAVELKLQVDTSGYVKVGMEKPVDKVSIVGRNQMVADLSIQMATMASNHLWMNLEQRLKRYLGWAYPGLKSLHNAVIRAVVKEPKEKVSTIMAAASKNERLIERASVLTEELRALLPLPNKRQTKTTAHLTLPLYHRILTDTAHGLLLWQGQDGPKARKFTGRLFTLLPTKDGFTTSYVPISSMFLMTILKDTQLETFDGDGRHLNHRSLWAKYFNLRAVETSRRHFRDRILTDGYAVSVLVSPREPGNASRGKSDSTLEEMREMIRLNCPDRSIVKVGIDPGFDDIITASFSDGRKPVSYSSAQYYEKAKIFYSQRRTSTMNEATKKDTDSLLGNGGCRTADPQQMATFLVTYLRVMRPLVIHRMMNQYRKLRFLRHVSKQQVVEQIVDKIVGGRKEGDLSLMIVGFGDWSGGYSSPVSRKCAGPIQMLKDKIGQRQNAAIKAVDEFRTSQLDSQSWEKLWNMKAVTYKKTKDGRIVEVLNNKVHKVLHCKPSDASMRGRVTTWNRDVNASINILMLLEHELRGFDRPEAFRRRTTNVGGVALRRVERRQKTSAMTPTK